MSEVVDFGVDVDALQRDRQLWIVITSDGKICSVASSLQTLEECAFDAGKDDLANLIRRAGEDFFEFARTEGVFQKIPGTQYLVAKFGFLLCHRKTLSPE